RSRGALGHRSQPAIAEHGGSAARIVVHDRSLWLRALSGRSGAGQRSLLAGVLHQDPAAAGDGGAGVDGDLVHLRAAAF
nr:hypothetical protein [Tanacetum cinerariifolium]